MTMTMERPPQVGESKPFRVEVLDHTAREESWVANGVRFRFLGEAWKHGEDLLARWTGPQAFRIMHERDDEPWAISTCSLCPAYARGQMMPSHRGSSGCESGSLASGGDRAHCTCTACF